MEKLPFLELIEEDTVTKSSSAFAIHVKKTWEDRNQFEEEVQYLLHEYEQNKPADVFY